MTATREKLGSIGNATLWWVFGIATTLALISLWGRSVVSDRQVVADAARELARVELVSDQVVGWLMAGLESAPGDAAAVDEFVDAPAVQAAVSRIVEEVVTAAYEPEASTIDIGEILSPLAPRLAAELQSHGLAVGAMQVEQALEGVPPIVIDPDQTAPTLAARVNRPLTTATLVAALTMVAAAALLLASSRDRVTTARSLALRVAVSGLSFAVVLRVAAWIADPGGGSSPVRRTLAVILSSRPEVPLVVAGVAAALLTAGVIVTRKKGAAVR